MRLSVCPIEFQIFLFHLFHKNNYHVHRTIIIFRMSKTNLSFLNISVDKLNTILFPANYGGGQLKKSLKKSKSISGILGWVLTFFDPKF